MLASEWCFFSHLARERSYILFRLPHPWLTLGKESTEPNHSQLGVPCPSKAECHCGDHSLERIMSVSWIGPLLLIILWTRHVCSLLVIVHADSGYADMPWWQERKLEANDRLNNPSQMGGLLPIVPVPR